MSKKTLNEQLDSMREVVKRTEPIGLYLGDMPTRVMQAYSAGEPIVAVKSFTAGKSGRQYLPGDELDLTEIGEAGLVRLAGAHFIRPGQEFDRTRRAAAMKDLLENFVAPKIGRCNLIHRELEQARAAIPELERQLKDAHDRVATLTDQLRAATEEAEEVISGPNMQLFTS